MNDKNYEDIEQDIAIIKSAVNEIFKQTEPSRENRWLKYLIDDSIKSIISKTKISVNKLYENICSVEDYHLLDLAEQEKKYDTSRMSRKA